MLSLARSGPLSARIAAEIRAVPAQKVPLVAAKALTFTVQKAQAGILARMGSAFEGGANRYTLGSTRIEPATPAKLSARVAVKDRAAAGGNVPESYLAPQVFGGVRREKRFERALRFAGLLKSGERAVIGDEAPTDAQGNYSIGQLRSLLKELEGAKREATGRRRARSDGRKKGGVFVGTPKGGKPGVYRRYGETRADKSLKPLLIFVRKAPAYASRLDFAGVAEGIATREFPETFLRLLRKAVA